MTAKKISWKTLKHHAGSAVKVPSFVEHLVAGGDAHKPASDLDEALVQPGVWCPASAPTLELLFNQLGSAQYPEWVLSVIAESLGNDQTRAWLEGMGSAPSDVLDVVSAHRDKLWQALSSDDPIVRSAAGYCAAVVPDSLRAEAAAQVTRAARKETDPTALSSLLLALGALTTAEDDAFAFIDESLAHASPDVRGAAALAKLRVVPALKLESVQAELADWLKRTIHNPVSEQLTTRPEFWWFTRYRPPGGDFRWPLRRSGVGLGLLLRDRGCPEAWIEALIALGEVSDDGLVSRAISDAFTVAFELDKLKPDWTVPPELLTDAQRGLAHRLVDSRLFARGGYGFSSIGSVRRRWLGLAEPGPMEKLVELEEAGQTKQVPLYVAWQRWVHSGPGWKNEFPPQAESLVGAERWQALAEYRCATYWSTDKGMERHLMEREIELARAATDLEGLAPQVLDDCARRLRRRLAEEQPITVSPLISALLLLPIAIAKVPRNPEWETLFAADDDPENLVKKVVAVLPKDALDVWLWNNQQKQKVEIHYVESLPTARHPKRSLYTIHNARKAGKNIPEVSLELERKIHELAKTVPHFAEAVKEFEAETAG